MKVSKWLLVIATLCVAFPAAAVDVNVDYDKSADFSKYKTYARKAMTPAPSSLVQGRIDDAIDRELAARGWSKVESGADIHVITHASVGKETLITADHFGGYGGYRGGRGWGGGWGTTHVNVSEIGVGTLLVDMVDAGSSQLVWRAVASATVTHKAEKSEKKITKAAKKMFKDFPPGQGE